MGVEKVQEWNRKRERKRGRKEENGEEEGKERKGGRLSSSMHTYHDTRYFKFPSLPSLFFPLLLSPFFFFIMYGWMSQVICFTLRRKILSFNWFGLLRLADCSTLSCGPVTNVCSKVIIHEARSRVRSW